MKIQIAGFLSQQVLAESAFQITNLAVATKPAVAPFNKVVKYTFAGFRPGKPIFGHFQSGGKVVLTYKFGKTSGPCGILHTKSRLFPGHASANAKVQGPVRRLEEALQEGEPEDRHRPRLDLLATRPNSPQTL